MHVSPLLQARLTHSVLPAREPCWVYFPVVTVDSLSLCGCWCVLLQAPVLHLCMSPATSLRCPLPASGAGWAA